MLKYFALIFVLLFSVSSVHANVSTNGLSEIQKAELALKAAEMKEAQSAIPVTPQIAKEWAEVGQAVGQGLVATAKELGMSADEVMTTTTGKIAAALIIWKVAGEDIIGILFGFIWLMGLVPAWIILYRNHGSRKITGYGSVEVSSKLWALVGKDVKVRKKVPEYKETAGELKFMWLVALILIVLVGTLAIFG